MEAVLWNSNVSSSTEAKDSPFDGWMFADDYVIVEFEYVSIVLAVIGAIGNLFVHLVSRYMVHTKHKAG